MLCKTDARILAMDFYPQFSTGQMSLRGGFFALPDEAIPCYKEYFNSKGDCFAATPSLSGAREVQERRLAQCTLWGTTSIHGMYSREIYNMTHREEFIYDST
jgi:hypothetical protein